MSKQPYTGKLSKHLPLILDMVHQGKSDNQIMKKLSESDPTLGHEAWDSWRGETYRVMESGRLIYHIRKRYGLLKTRPEIDYETRDKAIYARRKQGLTLRAIGKEFGIGAERVRYIVWRESCRERIKT